MFSNPAITLNKDVLPDALGPIMDTISSSFMDKLRLSKILSPSRFSEIFLISNFILITNCFPN